MNSIEGKKSSAYAHKKNGQETDLSEHVGDGHCAVQADVTGAEKIGVGSGRTIELAQYEFARVDIGLNVHIKDKAKADSVREMCQAVVNEMLAREENEIAGGNRADKPLEWDSSAVFACSIYIGYGLTLKGEKRFESHRIDQSRLWQVDDSRADFLAEIALVSAWVVEGVKDKADQVRGIGNDTGL